MLRSRVCNLLPSIKASNRFFSRQAAGCLKSNAEADEWKGHLLLGSLAFIKPPGFVAIAATLHVAPATTVTFALVQEQPSAVFGGAHAHVVEVFRGEQFGRFIGNGP